MNCNCEFCKSNKPFEMPKEIIEAAIEGNLVLFCGAGISTEGKNVLPYTFYKSIKDELGEKDDNLSFSALMQEYCNQPNGRRKLLKNIRDRFQYIHSFPELEWIATQFHRELSEIYTIRTIITTNWDTYFEEYCGAIPITIPEDFAFYDDKSRFVIKIHGSINNLSSIIATTEDYNKCYEQLQNGVIGGTLKNILATKVVVFIGFSFGDEDFAQIIEYLRKEMGDIYPHIYVVTLDNSLQDRIDYSQSTYIVTSGTFFLHNLKNTLIEKNIIRNNDIQGIVYDFLDKMNDIHMKTSRIKIQEYRTNIYALAYQDGVIHACERFLQLSHTGDYNQPSYICKLIKYYERITDEYRKKGDYLDMSYYEGYINGLALIDVCRDNPELIDSFPYYYLPNAKKELSSYELFLDEVKRTSFIGGKYSIFAKKILGEKIDKNTIVHHPPYPIN